MILLVSGFYGLLTGLIEGYKFNQPSWISASLYHLKRHKQTIVVAFAYFYAGNHGVDYFELVLNILVFFSFYWFWFERGYSLAGDDEKWYWSIIGETKKYILYGTLVNKWQYSWISGLFAIATWGLM